MSAERSHPSNMGIEEVKKIAWNELYFKEQGQ
jgi:hypothetical protein